MFDPRTLIDLDLFASGRREERDEDSDYGDEENRHPATDGARASPPSRERGEENPATAGAESDGRGENNVGAFGISNTMASVVLECLSRAEERFGIRIPRRGVQDVNLGRNPLRVEDVTPMMRPRIEEELLRLSHEVDHALVPSSLGTGFPLYKFIDLDLVFEGTIDVTVPSHKTAPSDLYRHPQNAILAGLGVAVMDSPAILIDHRAAERGMEAVKWELAKALGAITLTDVANRGYGYWGMAIDTVPIGGRSEMDLNPAVQRAAHGQTPWVSPEQWAPWAIENKSIDPDEPVPTLADPDRIAIVPRGVTLGQHEELRVVDADVDNVHVLSFWPLDATWIDEHVRRAGAEYVDSEIHQPTSPLNQVWEAHTQRFGVDDPVARWERFYDDHVEPALPDP